MRPEAGHGDCPTLRFDGCLAPDFLEVRGVLARTLTALGALALSEDQIGTVEIVLAEALNNVVQHSARARSIVLRVIATRCAILCTLADDGAPAGLPAAPASAFPEPDDLPEGGYGLALIAALAEDVRLESGAGGNVLSFRIGLAGRALH